MAALLEITFNLTEESVHLYIFLFIKLFSNPGKTRKHHIHKPVRPNLVIKTLFKYIPSTFTGAINQPNVRKLLKQVTDKTQLNIYWRHYYLWNVFLLSNTDKVFKHGHHRRSSDHMAIDQIGQKTHLQQQKKY